MNYYLQHSTPTDETKSRTHSSYEWRSLTTFSYTIDDLYIALRWQHLDSIDTSAAATVETTPNRQGAKERIAGITLSTLIRRRRVTAISYMCVSGDLS